MSDESEKEAFGRSIPIEQLKRAARLYHANGDAAAALGITARSFARLCRKHDIQTPYRRRSPASP